MPKPEYFILTDPGNPCLAFPAGAVPIRSMFRLGPRFELLQLRGSERARGGILMVSAVSTPPAGNVDHFCAQLLFACAARGFRGVFLNFDGHSPALSAAAVRLGRELARRNMPLLLPEAYAPLVPTARALISSAISGGSLTHRLEQAVQRFGPRSVFALEPVAEDFLLPAPDGCGTPLTPAQLARLRQEHGSRDHFSRALCSRYFLYQDGEQRPHLVLFDDPDALNQKLNAARKSGFRAFVLPARHLSQLHLFR